MTNWQLAILSLVAWSGAYSLVVINSISYRQQVTPEALMGRVNTAGRMLAWDWAGRSEPWRAVLSARLSAYVSRW
ncbi:MAG: hypothetical protein WKF73_20610 [Nocardioidaceae bacterium]